MALTSRAFLVRTLSSSSTPAGALHGLLVATGELVAFPPLAGVAGVVGLPAVGAGVRLVVERSLAEPLVDVGPSSSVSTSASSSRACSYASRSSRVAQILAVR